jgi:hypothetical protein
MTRFNFLMWCLISTLLFACSKDENPVTISKEVNIQAVEWKIDKFTTPDGATINQALFVGDAKFISELTYVFDKNNVVKSFDKVSKLPQAYGTWKVINSESQLEINIQGFAGIFDIIQLDAKKMILRNNIRYGGAEIPVNMEFVPNI